MNDILGHLEIMWLTCRIPLPLSAAASASARLWSSFMYIPCGCIISPLPLSALIVIRGSLYDFRYGWIIIVCIGLAHTSTVTHARTPTHAPSTRGHRYWPLHHVSDTGRRLLASWRVDGTCWWWWCSRRRSQVEVSSDFGWPEIESLEGGGGGWSKCCFRLRGSLIKDTLQPGC